MSTISAAQSYQTYAAQRPPHSEKNHLAAAIGSEVSVGALSQTDATALTSALDSIDQSLASDRTSASTGGSASRLDRAAMKDRIDGLIADQVGSGALTSDQADTLKELFAQQGGKGGPDGGMGGMSGPPPGPPPGGMQGGSDDPGDTASSGASGMSGSSASDLLASFVGQLKAAQSSGASYAASGQTGSQQASALLFDFTT